MNRTLIYVLFGLPIMATAAVASTTFYYTPGGECDGLFLNSAPTSCDQAVTKITAPASSGKNFSGVWLDNGLRVIDSVGNLLVGRQDVSALDKNSRHATSGFQSANQILVMKAQKWMDDTSWYTCGGVTFQLCDENGNFYVPYKTYCHKEASGSINPNSDGSINHDFVFNSWRMADGEFKLPSRTTGSPKWEEHYGIAGTYGVSTGDSYVAAETGKGCVGGSGNTLGVLNTANDGPNGFAGKVSKDQIWPFACKAIKQDSKWWQTYAITGGTLSLDVSEPSVCKYVIHCDKGWTVSDAARQSQGATCGEATNSSKECSKSCQGHDECRNFFDGSFATLFGTGDFCVEEAEPQCLTSLTVDGTTTVSAILDSDLEQCSYNVTCKGDYHPANQNGVYHCNLGECPSSVTGFCVPYTVLTLNFNGGGTGTTISRAAGEQIGVTLGDRADGATFGGWYRDGESESSASVNKVVVASSGESVTYHAKWNCQTGFSKNSNGICVADDEENATYVATDGTPLSGQALTCWRDSNGNPIYGPNIPQNAVNYCYWHGKITLHNTPPTETLEGAAIKKWQQNNNGQWELVDLADGGAQGSILYCHGMACWYNQNYSGDWINGIPHPHAIKNGEHTYSFRGYYYDGINGHTSSTTNAQILAGLPNDIITSQGTTNGGAFSVFYSKGTVDSAKTIGIVGHTIVVMSDTPVGMTAPTIDPDHTGVTWPEGTPEGQSSITPPTSATGYDIHLYGGWAKKCNSTDADPHAVCELQQGTSWNTTNGLGKGDVRYNTSCTGSYQIYNGNNTWNPTCSANAENLNISYQFKNQYYDDVTCNADTTCATNSNWNTLSSATACGSNLTLRWLETSNQKFYKPNFSTSCNTNTLGLEDPATVIAYVCEPCVTPANGECRDITDSSTIHYVSNSTGTSTNTASLWGANSDLGQPACQKIVCNSGYELYNGQCMEPYQKCLAEINNDPNLMFKCQHLLLPRCPDGLEVPNGVSIGYNYTDNPGTSANQTATRTCKYTVGCNTSSAVLNTGRATEQITCDITVNNGTVNNTNCTKAWVQTQINNASYSCFSCPTAGQSFALPSNTASVQVAQQEGLVCRYGLYCNSSSTLKFNAGSDTTPDWENATTSYTYPSSSWVVVENGNIIIKCNNGNDRECEKPIMQSPTYENLASKFRKFKCQ